jgi:hypothetical protein
MFYVSMLFVFGVVVVVVMKKRMKETPPPPSLNTTFAAFCRL